MTPSDLPSNSQDKKDFDNWKELINNKFQADKDKLQKQLIAEQKRLILREEDIKVNKVIVEKCKSLEAENKDLRISRDEWAKNYYDLEAENKQATQTELDLLINERKRFIELLNYKINSQNGLSQTDIRKGRKQAFIELKKELKRR